MFVICNYAIVSIAMYYAMRNSKGFRNVFEFLFNGRPFILIVWVFLLHTAKPVTSKTNLKVHSQGAILRGISNPGRSSQIYFAVFAVAILCIVVSK